MSIVFYRYRRVQPDGCTRLIGDDKWVEASAPWQSDRVGGEARKTEDVYKAIGALFDLNTANQQARITLILHPIRSKTQGAP